MAVVFSMAEEIMSFKDKMSFFILHWCLNLVFFISDVIRYIGALMVQKGHCKLNVGPTVGAMDIRYKRIKFLVSLVSNKFGLEILQGFLSVCLFLWKY